MPTDDATEATLAAYEVVDRTSSLKGKRWYLEHVPFCTPEQMERIARLRLIVSVQDSGYSGETSSAVSPERLAHQNPVHELLDHNITVIAGSDYAGPRASDAEPNPFKLFAFYVTRRNVQGKVTSPAEKIGREEALRLFTNNAAFATFPAGRRRYRP